MTAVSQVQLIQPILTLLWSAALLGEPVTAAMIVGGAVIIGVRTRHGSQSGAGYWIGESGGATPNCGDSSIPHPLPVSR